MMSEMAGEKQLQIFVAKHKAHKAGVIELPTLGGSNSADVG